MVIIQSALVIVMLVLTTALVRFSQVVADEADKARSELDPTAVPKWVFDLVPTGHMVRSSLYPAVGVSCLVMLLLYMIFIPRYVCGSFVSLLSLRNVSQLTASCRHSAVSTILKYRCGELPSLKSHYFVKYRNNVDNVYSNVGNAIFGLAGSAGLFFILVGLTIFFIVWPITQDFMILLIAWGLGLTVTIVVKMILVKVCRKKFYRAFYRTRPSAANMATLALECWHVGMGGGVLLGR